MTETQLELVRRILGKKGYAVEEWLTEDSTVLEWRSKGGVSYALYFGRDCLFTEGTLHMAGIGRGGQWGHWYTAVLTVNHHEQGSTTSWEYQGYPVPQTRFGIFQRWLGIEDLFKDRSEVSS